MTLRPLEAGDVVDRAIRLYRDNFATFLLIVLSVRLPVVLLQAGQIYFLYEAGLMQFEDFGPQDFQNLDLNALGISMAIGMVALLPAFMANLVSSAALTWAAAQRYFGRPVSFGQAYRAAWGRIGHLAVGYLLWGLVIGVGLVFFVVPGIVLLVWFSFFFPVVMLERLGPVDCLGRSKRLVDGHWWQVAWPLLGLAIIAFVSPALVIGVPVSYLCEGWLAQVMPLAAAGGLGQFVYQVVLTALAPVLLCGLVVLYYDRRVRMEGLDLELRAQEMAEAA
ncbi:MAG: hypothetical protein ACE5R4_14610 [Armatimonadota bacterium]